MSSKDEAERIQSYTNLVIDSKTRKYIEERLSIIEKSVLQNISEEKMKRIKDEARMHLIERNKEDNNTI